MGALTRDAVGKLRRGAPGRSAPSARSARWPRPAWWPTSAGFCWGLAAAALALTIATVVIAVADGDFLIISLVPGSLAAALIGGVVAARRPGHPMGMLLCGYGLAVAVAVADFAYARAAALHFAGSLPFGVPAMWIGSWVWVPVFAIELFILPLVFPDGRLLSRRWRPALWAAVAFIPLSVAGNAFEYQSLGSWVGNRPNPYGVHGPLFRVILDVANVWGLAVALAAAASVALRWRRGGLVVRQQLKWFLVTVPFLYASAVVTQDFPDALTLALVVGGAASLLMVVAIGLPVLRYGLYEIDVLISRGVVYGLLSCAVAGIYLAAAAAAGGLTGAGWDLNVPVLATVVAAAVLLPVRGRLQRRVDRLFFGDRGAPYAAMARLGRQVEEATTAEPVLSSVVAGVAGSLRLPYAAVELRAGDGWVPGAAWGEPAPQVVAFPLTFQGETVGRLLVGQRAAGERLSPDDERLLASLARQVAPAAHAVALRQALDASRAALVTAREEERRRLRRDLHDGLGPTLAALVLGLQTACTLPAGSRQQEALLNTLKAETQGAVTDIRRIVYGLRPPALDELGLAGALRAEVARLGREPSGPSIALDIPGDELGELPAAVEVAAYRIITEAVTNVIRHARASHCQIRVRPGPDLRLEVRDDGAGLPDGWRAGVGVTAMRERAAELGGELMIEPARPRGTRITARLPVSGPGLHTP